MALPEPPHSLSHHPIPILTHVFSSRMQKTASAETQAKIGLQEYSGDSLTSPPGYSLMPYLMTSSGGTPGRAESFSNSLITLS